ncbi:MAG: phasin family protein [Pseudomonadota bacterium]
MKNIEDFEVPEAVRQMAEKNVELAKNVYEQFMDAARQAQSAMQQTSGTAAADAHEVQARAISYAEQNMEAGFAFLSELAKAKDIKECVEIQNRHAEKAIKAYQEQADEMGKIMTGMTHKAKPDT